MATEGAVDAILGRFVVGWAYERRDGDHRVEVEVELDGSRVGEGTADLERGDLRAAGIGDGRHAFRIELPEAPAPGSEHWLTVRSQSDGSILPLAGDFMVELEDERPGPLPIIHSGLGGDSGFEPEDEPAGAAVAAPRGYALMGSGGWLFSVRDRESLDRILGRAPLPQEELDGIRARLRANAKSLHALGVAYVAAAIPDKATLYTNRLSADAAPVWSDLVVRRIQEALHDENHVDLIDLRTTLRHARRHGDLMPRIGTELTWLGAFHAYRAIAKELAKRFGQLEPLPADALQLGVEIQLAPDASLSSRPRTVLVGGELIDVHVDPEPVETEPDLVASVLRARYVPLPKRLELDLERGSTMLENPRADLKAAAIVVHEGRGGRIASLLAEHFATTIVTVGHEVPLTVVEHEGPSVVVQLLEEANLCIGPTP